MSVFTYRNIGTNQMVYVGSPMFDGNPLWELVIGGSGGDITVHEADSTNVHGIVNTAQLETISGAAAQVAAHAADTTSVHGVDDMTVLQTIAGTNTAISTHAGAADPHGDRSFATASIATHAGAADPHGDRAAATAAIATHAGAADPHGDRAYAASTTSTAVTAHSADSDPHGDRSFATSAVSTHAGAADPHSDRSFATSAVSTHAGAADPHGDRAYTDSTLATHAADTTAVHGITDTSVLETTSGTAAAVTAHAGAADPHGDRAYAASLNGGHGSATRFETIPRHAAGANATLTSGTMLLGYFTAPTAHAGVTTITIASGSGTISSGLTLGRLALFSVAGNGDITLLQASTNDTTLLNSGSTVYTGTIASTPLVAGQRYAVGVLTVGSGPGNVRSAASISGLTVLAPTVARAMTGQTDIPTGTTAVGSLTTTANVIYAGVS